MCIRDSQGGLGQQIALLLLHVFYPALQQLNHPCAFGQHNGQSLTYHVHGGEVFQFPAQLAVIPLQGLFPLSHVSVQGLLAVKGGAVNALEHFVFLAAAPVSAGGGQKLHGLDPAGGGQVGAGAQVSEFALTIEGNHCVFGQIVDQLHLVGLVLHQFQRLRPGQLEALQPFVFLDDPSHFLLHFLEKFGSEGHIHVEIVIEAVVNGGADGQLHLGARLFYGLGQHMAGGVAHDLAAVCVAEVQNFQHAVLVDGLGQGNHPAVDAGRQGGLLQILGNFARDVQGVFAVLKFVFLTVDGKLHVKHPPSFCGWIQKSPPHEGTG